MNHILDPIFITDILSILGGLPRLSICRYKASLASREKIIRVVSLWGIHRPDSTKWVSRNSGNLHSLSLGLLVLEQQNPQKATVWRQVAPSGGGGVLEYKEEVGLRDPSTEVLAACVWCARCWLLETYSQQLSLETPNIVGPNLKMTSCQHVPIPPALSTFRQQSDRTTYVCLLLILSDAISDLATSYVLLILRSWWGVIFLQMPNPTANPTARKLLNAQFCHPFGPPHDWVFRRFSAG